MGEIGQPGELKCIRRQSLIYFSKWKPYLHLTRVKKFGRVCDEPAGPVPLHAGNHVVRPALDAFRDDTKAVVFSSSTTTDAAKQPLLNAFLELDDSYARRRCRNLDGDLADGEPWRNDTGRMSVPSENDRAWDTYRRVMSIVYQNSCILTKRPASG